MSSWEWLRHIGYCTGMHAGATRCAGQPQFSQHMHLPSGTCWQPSLWHSLHATTGLGKGPEYRDPWPDPSCDNSGSTTLRRGWAVHL
eukprot:2179032-Amphidinium_carterae.1